MKTWLVCLLLLAGSAQAAAPHALAIYDSPRLLPRTAFVDGNGNALTLDAFKGKVVVMDFWATWCVPCRVEFPALERLQARLGAKGLVVVPVSIDRKGMPAVNKFYEETKITGLNRYLDDSHELTPAMAVSGLPTTVIIDRNGGEVGRVEGPADWDSAEVIGQLEAVLKR